MMKRAKNFERMRRLGLGGYRRVASARMRRIELQETAI